MRRIALLYANLAAALPALFAVTPAQAVDFITFVASTGGGTACTRAAPCADLTTAQAATAVRGEIKCLDSGPIAGGTISKSITIDCGDTGATVNGSITINAAADSVVRIRNLSILNLFGVGSIDGINFQSGAALLIENCVIENFIIASPVAGIRFRPSATGSQLVVTNTIISYNGTVGSATGGGIIVSPQAGGNALVSLSRVTTAKNVFGIVADGTGSTGGINMTISDSVSNGNTQDGIIAVTPAGGAPIGVMVKNTRSTNNAIGIRSIGPNVTVRVDGSTIIGNGTGLSFSGGGALLTAGNNTVEANGSNGAFSSSYALK